MYNSAPAYRQVHNVSATEPDYIFRISNGDWVAGKELGDSRNAGLGNSNKSPAPPRSGWKYWDTNEWRSDPYLSIVTISDTSTRICPVIDIQATGAAAREVSDYLGQFSITTQFSTGRPMWRNNRGKYLRVHPDSTAWGVVDNVETNFARIRSGAAGGLCPASSRSRYHKRFNYNSWQYWDGDEWREGDITVTCNNPNIICDD